MFLFKIYSAKKNQKPGKFLAREQHRMRCSLAKGPAYQTYLPSHQSIIC